MELPLPLRFALGKGEIFRPPQPTPGLGRKHWHTMTKFMNGSWHPTKVFTSKRKYSHGNGHTENSTPRRVLCVQWMLVLTLCFCKRRLIIFHWTKTHILVVRVSDSPFFPNGSIVMVGSAFHCTFFVASAYLARRILFDFFRWHRYRMEYLYEATCHRKDFSCLSKRWSPHTRTVSPRPFFLFFNLLLSHKLFLVCYTFRLTLPLCWEALSQCDRFAIFRSSRRKSSFALSNAHHTTIISAPWCPYMRNATKLLERYYYSSYSACLIDAWLTHTKHVMHFKSRTPPDFRKCISVKIGATSTIQRATSKSYEKGAVYPSPSGYLACNLEISILLETRYYMV